MSIANEYQAPLARLIYESYLVDHLAIQDFDSTITDDFIVAWVEKMVVVEALVLPEVVTRLMSDKIDARNTCMTNETELIKVLALKIEQARKAGTITQSLASFMLDNLNQSINKLSITKFTAAFAATIAQVNANATALNTIGFTTAMQNNFKGNAANALIAQSAYDNLKISRKNLTPANILSIADLYSDTVTVCTAGIGAFAMPFNESKTNQYIIAKALSSVRPTPGKGSRDRHIAATKSICLKTNPIKKDTLQLTLLTAVAEPVYFCMQDLKTGVCTSGGVLTLDVTTNIKQKDIPGTGKHLVISNQNLINIIVRVFTIKG